MTVTYAGLYKILQFMFQSSSGPVFRNVAGGCDTAVILQSAAERGVHKVSWVMRFDLGLKKQRLESTSLHSRFSLGCLKQKILQLYSHLPWFCGSWSLSVGEMEAAQPGCWSTELGEKSWKLCSFLPHCSHRKSWCLDKAKHGANGQKLLKQQWGAAHNWLVE